MEKGRLEISPQSFATIAMSGVMSDLDEQALLYLYQPIIGANAFAIYLTLRDETIFSKSKEPVLHGDLFSIVNLDISNFYKARTLLEGIGLLDVYEKNDMDFGKMYFYELHPALSPSTFFKNDIMVSLLISEVGNARYERLVERFATPESPDKTGYQKTTKNFMEVYGYQPERVIAHEDKITKGQTQVSENEYGKISFKGSEFDIPYFRFELSRYGITLETQDIDEILLIHSMYGINELELSLVAKDTSEVGVDKVDIKAMKKLIREREQEGKVKKIVNPVAIAATLQSEKLQQQALEERKQILKTKGLPEDEIQLMLDSEQLTPMEFLRKIQQQKNVSQDNLEDYALEDAVRKSRLSNPVINILVHYVLVTENRQLLTTGATFRNALRDWENAEVSTSEEALERIREREKKKEERKTHPSQNYGGKPKRKGNVEKIPDWMKSQTETENVSEKEKEEIRNRLLNAGNNGGDTNG
ncbi:MAG: hypothetical protein LBM95_00900 [Lactobacillales bacterium]|jgi:replication initiation and membrane attachment protein|nr:hypothetical protein [Lactobacillales bacterium]